MTDDNRKKHSQALLNMPIWKALIILAIPIIIANVLQSSYFLANAFWVGRLGAGGAATIAIVGVIFFLVMSLGAGLSISGSILVSQYYGARDWKMINSVSAQSMTMMGLAGLVLGIFGYIFAPTLAVWIGADGGILSDTISFLRITFLGLIFTFWYFMFQSIMRSIGRPNIPIVILLITLVLNFILNPILIFSIGDLPNFGIFTGYIRHYLEFLGGGFGMGVTGAALTTLITQTLASMIGFWIMWSGRYDLEIKFRDFKPDFKIIWKSFLLGYPASIEMLARSLAFTLLTKIVAGVGAITILSSDPVETALAGFGAGRNVMQFMIIFTIGISMANTILVGGAIGSNDISRAKKINYTSAIASCILMLILGGLSFIFAPTLISFFVPSETDVIAVGSRMLYIGAPFFFLMGLQMSFGGTVRAAGKTFASMIVTIIGWIFVILPVAYFLPKVGNMGLDGVWWATPIGSIVNTILIMIVYFKMDWSKSNLTHRSNK